MQSLRGALQLCKSKQQFVRTSERDGPLRDKMAPDPVMMTNDADGVEVRAVAHRMAVGNDNNVVMICDRGSDSRINAEISCPSGDQDPIRRDLLQARLQVRPAERIIQILADNNISGISSQIGKKRPAGRLRFEIVALAAAMLTKITVPDRSRTLAASRLMRSMTPGKSCLGSPLRSPTCISTTSIASMRGPGKSAVR